MAHADGPPIAFVPRLVAPDAFDLEFSRLLCESRASAIAAWTAAAAAGAATNRSDRTGASLVALQPPGGGNGVRAGHGGGCEGRTGTGTIPVATEQAAATRGGGEMALATEKHVKDAAHTRRKDALARMHLPQHDSTQNKRQGAKRSRAERAKDDTAVDDANDVVRSGAHGDHGGASGDAAGAADANDSTAEPRYTVPQHTTPAHLRSDATSTRADIRARRWVKCNLARFAVQDSANMVKIQNMVFTINLGVALSLCDIARRCFRFAEYNPQRFAAVIIRLHAPVVTILIFSTGKGVITGCKSTCDLAVALRHLQTILNDIGIGVPHLRSKLRNVVANATLSTKVNLDRLATLLAEEACYDPELFPGLVYRPHSRDVSLLVFESGAVVLTGCDDENAVRAANAHVERIKQLVLDDDAVDQRAVHRHSKRAALSDVIDS